MQESFPTQAVAGWAIARGVSGAKSQVWFEFKTDSEPTRPAAKPTVTSETHANKHNNQRVHKNRKGPMRISDLLPLRIGHFVDDSQHFWQRFWIKEQKRCKRHELVINQSIRDALNEYLEAYPGVIEKSDHFVFFNTKAMDHTTAIKRGQAWKFIVNICHDVGLRM